MQTDGVRRSRKCGERSIKGTKTLAYRSTGSPCAHSSLALRPITEQSNTLFSALHHRNVNKLLETLASRPCLFSWVEPWEKYNFGFRVALLVLCALCEASIAFFHVWMIRLPPCTSAFCTFCGGGQGGGGGQALSCRVTSWVPLRLSQTQGLVSCFDDDTKSCFCGPAPLMISLLNHILILHCMCKL